MSVMDDFGRRFHDALDEVLGWGVELTDDDRPGSIEGWDSLAQIRIVHELENRFSIRLPDEALLEPHTVAALRTMVRDRVHELG